MGGATRRRAGPYGGRDVRRGGRRAEEGARPRREGPHGGGATVPAPAAPLSAGRATPALLGRWGAAVGTALRPLSALARCGAGRGRPPPPFTEGETEARAGPSESSPLRPRLSGSRGAFPPERVHVPFHRGGGRWTEGDARVCSSGRTGQHFGL